MMSILLVAHNLDVLGSIFTVGTPSDIDDLTKMVKEKRQIDTAHVDAPMLTVWRCTDRTTTFNLNEEMLNRRIRDLFSNDAVEEVPGNLPISRLNISEGETLLVTMPRTLPAGTCPRC